MQEITESERIKKAGEIIGKLKAFSRLPDLPDYTFNLWVEELKSYSPYLLDKAYKKFVRSKKKGDYFDMTKLLISCDEISFEEQTTKKQKESFKAIISGINKYSKNEQERIVGLRAIRLIIEISGFEGQYLDTNEGRSEWLGLYGDNGLITQLGG